MEPPESRRKKLAILIRSLAEGKVKQAQEVLRSAAAGGGADPPHPPAGPIALEAATPGVEAANEQGRFWLIHRSLGDVSPADLDAQRQYAAVLRGARHRFDELEASAAVCHLANSTPEGPLFMDIESCGLSGACIFLIGLMGYADGELVFDQLLARHYGEEAAILSAFGERLGSAAALVTFNGKAFDMTNIRERAVVHGLDLWLDEPPHCDILHESRRRWRGILPNCRLQTLERHLCRRRRAADIPGAEIPRAYHDFVASGDATRITAILHHNVLDLLTMSQLLCLILTGEQPDVDAWQRR